MDIQGATCSEQYAYGLMQEISSWLNNKNFEQARQKCIEFLQQFGKGKAAVQVGELLVKLSPKDADAFNFLGNALESIQNYTGAAKSYEMAFNLNPEHGIAMSNCANMLMRYGAVEQALSLYKRSIQYLNEKHKDAVVMNMMNVYIDLRDFSKVEELAFSIEKSTDINKAQFYSLIGNMHVAQGNDILAEEDFLKALEIEPERLATIDNLAVLYDRNCNIDKAREWFIKGFDIRKRLNNGNPMIFSEQSSVMSPFKYHYMIYLNDKRLSDVPYTILHARTFDDYHRENNKIPYCLVDDTMAIAEMNDIQITGNGFCIIDGKNLYDDVKYSLTGNPDFISTTAATGDIYIRASEQIENINKPVFVIGGAKNYYHWICDYLPRFRALSVRPEFSDIKIAVNADLTDYQKTTLAKIGIDERRLIYFSTDKVYHLTKAFVPYQIGGRTDMMIKPSVKWLRQQFASWMVPDGKYPKRIFISRDNAQYRRCVNEVEVYELAKRYGFKKIENETLTFQEQVALYAGAEAIMGVHGAGFTNILFSPEDSHIIELHPKASLPQYYRHIALCLGQGHIAIGGDITMALKVLSADSWDFKVNIDMVSDVLKKIGKPL